MRKRLRSWRVADTPAIALRVVTVLAVCLLTACLTSTPSASVGAVFGRDPDSGALHVREVPAGLAADEAGLLPGDRVKMIDGLYVDDLDATRIHTLLRGAAGSTVTLTIVRDGEVQHLEVTRRQLGKPPKVETGEQRIE